MHVSGNSVMRKSALAAAAAAMAAAAFLGTSASAQQASKPATATAPASKPAATAPKPAAPVARKVTTLEVTDQEVVASMKKGVEFLLNELKGKNNWETKFDAKGKPLRTKELEDKKTGTKKTVPDVWPGNNFGGETALALYAVLHVGESMREDGEFGERLKFNSKELEPVVRWLSDIRPDGTYTAGLHSSALALVNKETELGKSARNAMRYSYAYLMTAMDEDGGYAYSGPRTRDDMNLFEAWDAYIAARVKNDKAGSDSHGKALTYLASQAALKFGGVQMMVDCIVVEIRKRETDAKSKSDSAGQKFAQNEMKELQMLTPELIKAASVVKDPAIAGLETAQRRMADAIRAKQTGAVPKKDANGKPMKDSKGRPIMVPGSREEIDKELADAKAALEAEEKRAVKRFTPRGDLSNAQYGTLGTWAQADAGEEIPMAYWQTANRFWRLTQQPNGSWPYSPARPENDRASMTMAGIASLSITSAMTDTTIRLDPKPDPELERGLEWVNTHFKPVNDGYTMYGVERVGLATGLKFFGTRNWYVEGASLFIKTQAANGSWMTHGSPIVGTSYSLLFLARGRNPVLFNKLEYAGPWNARPRDNANVTDWISKNLERATNWQVVNLKVDPEQWLDAPVLLITGSKALKFTPEEVAKIRAYINAGGIVFSTADGDRSEFTESIKKLASQVVDEDGKPKYEMRELPKEHVLFSLKNELWKPVSKPGRILAMSNGVREIWVHSTSDMGASWQGRKTATNGDHFIFAANLYRYASGKASLRSKLSPLNVAVSKDKPARTIAMARVNYSGNWDPEPGAWPRLAKLLAVTAKTKLDIKEVKIADLDAKITPVAHMTGTTGFPSNPNEIAAMKKFIADGGTLIADAAGGSSEFRHSFDQFIQKVTDKPVPFAPIPATSKVVNGSIPDAVDATQPTYRMYYRFKMQGKSGMMLKGVEIDGRYAVILSEEDITSGLLGTNTWGILGHTADSAVDMARDLILFGANPKAGNDGAPAAAGAAAAAEEVK